MSIEDPIEDRRQTPDRRTTSVEVSEEQRRRVERREAISIKVLFLDDEAPLRMIGKRILEKDGLCQVEVVDNAQSLLDKLRNPSMKYNVVVADDRMPGMSGSEAIRTAKADGLLNETQVIMCSGTLDPTVAQELGVEFLGKPYNAAQLGGKVKEAYNKSQSASGTLEGGPSKGQ